MDKLARVIRLFSESPKFTIEGKLANFPKRPNSTLYLPKVDYDKLTESYGLKPNDFREKLAVLSNPEELNSENPNYKINWVTSIDARAANERKLGEKEPFFQLAAIGVTITKDNQIVLGVRGGEVTPERVQQYASGLYGLAPGGSVKFKSIYMENPITDTLHDEFHEEIGNFEVSVLEILGVFEAYRPGPTGIKFVGEIRTDATLEQIQETNMRANKIRGEYLEKKASTKDIRSIFEYLKLPIDSWEHSPIIGLPNDKGSMRKFIEVQPQSFSGIGAGALGLYMQYISSFKR
ncbi:MAG: hypothetical protein AABX28_02575 [Nanoarchaeota archaeon]